MYRVRGYYDRFRGGDPLMQMIAIAALILLAVIALPRLWGVLPGASSGIPCLSLPMPKISGNNQSLLASTIDPSVLHLELVPVDIVISQGSTLSMEVRFINESMAPLTLMMVPGETTFRYTETEVGLLFSITTPDRRALGEPLNVRPPFQERQVFSADQLRVLGPRQRCNLRVDIDPARLNSAQIGQGQYEIVAVYRNRSRGQLPAVQARTPTPIFRDLGVWTGEVRSNAIILRVVPPGQPAQ
jgi:hypothetical protein